MEEKREIFIINHRDCTEDVIKRFDMKGCNPAYKPCEGSKLYLYQLKANFMD